MRRTLLLGLASALAAAAQSVVLYTSGPPPQARAPRPLTSYRRGRCPVCDTSDISARAGTLHADELEIPVHICRNCRVVYAV